jgi:hypothetical protein
LGTKDQNYRNISLLPENNLHRSQFPESTRSKFAWNAIWMVWKKDFHLHFHEEILTFVKIRLGQPDTHWQHRVGFDARALDPIRRPRLALLVQDMSNCGNRSWGSVGESRNGS